jgi:chaperone required for assembly of F1-ATPase
MLQLSEDKFRQRLCSKQHRQWQNGIEAMNNDFKAQFFDIMDAVIRDYKTRQMHK